MKNSSIHWFYTYICVEYCNKTNQQQVFLVNKTIQNAEFLTMIPSTILISHMIID